jgi:glycosyltransferase involved in cell wall biosynthesis
MTEAINFIILGNNAYADYEKRDMAGSMRLKNIFNPMLGNKDITISNLIILDLLGIQHDQKKQSTIPEVDCLSIGFSSIKNPLSVIRYLRLGMAFIKAHKKENSKNIIYNYQNPDIRNILLVLYAKYKGFKIVFDIVEDIRHFETKTRNVRLQKSISLFLLKRIPKYADAVFVISSHLEKFITNITSAKIPVLLLPISVDFDNFNENDLIKKENIIHIFYGGSFDPKDGLEYLLEAIEILGKTNHHFKLVLSGKAHPDDMKRIFPLINNNSLVDFRGFLSTQDYFKLLSSVDICCMTRDNSSFANAGFPFKLGEFLAAGKLIVASRVGDVEKYLTHKQNAFLINPENTSDIVEGLTYFIDNMATLTQSMGSEARKVAEHYFDAKVSSRYMLDKCLSI